jgi:hypothetical protein
LPLEKSGKRKTARSEPERFSWEESDGIAEEGAASTTDPIDSFQLSVPESSERRCVDWPSMGRPAIHRTRGRA